MQINIKHNLFFLSSAPEYYQRCSSESSHVIQSLVNNADGPRETSLFLKMSLKQELSHGLSLHR